MRSLEREELKQLLIKCWMTHDAMWFRHCIEVCGIEKANHINKAAVRSMAAIEIRRVAKALGVDDVQSMDTLRELIDAAWQLIKADFMEFTYSYPAPGAMRWDVGRCFAFEGVTQLGVADRYQCGIFPRVEAWFDALGIKYTVTPVMTGCMMQSEGECSREYTFTFGDETRA
jgi:hypothetical protein